MQPRFIARCLVGLLLLPAGCAKPLDSDPGTVTAAGAAKTDNVPALTPPLLTEQPTPQKPFVAAAGLRPALVRAGETIELVIEARTAPTWHIYAADGPAGVGMPTTLTLKLPTGVEPAGEWSYPEASPAREGESSIYEGGLVFRRALRLTGHMKPGPLAVSCDVRYQACDPFHCRPPTTLALAATAEVVASP
jgi:DsbC/DsbD-like thiol-disulfide interchange protein